MILGSKSNHFPDQKMDRNQELAVARMRDSVEKLGFSTEGYGDFTLMRFLIARSMDSDKAVKMFVQWRKWRADFVPLGYIPDAEVADELSAGKIFLQPPLRTGIPHPLLIVKASKHFPSKDQLQFKKFVVHLLDKTIASAVRDKELGNEKLIGILDLDKICYSNIDARGLITGFQFLQAYYPERLYKLYLLHMPGFFVRVWRLISRFLEKATLEKVMIVTNEEERKEFVRSVGEEFLPEEYGGRAKLTLMQDVVLTPPPPPSSSSSSEEEE
ncbi:CRAL-TRIO domain-containing protein YKL091C-like [Andrographis paniculata]|uniref:CRAL-TRIO domain-containing protein YKL091C-like n=1 Tax=Andrographis paniculata TaxID=175694 RepID=UPI0021E7FBF7|nr:CRAL-TRIO domain-containing protein YKL091C-like [Andrographis paniculata]